MPIKSDSAALFAIVFFLCAALFAQISALSAFLVPPRNWRQFSLYRRAYARVAPWRLRIGLVMVWTCTALAALCGVLVAWVVVKPLGPATVEDISTVTTLLLILGTVSLVISASAHYTAFRARRLTLRLLAQEDDKPAGPSGD
ncbi:MAG TPA: hypothetical protein VF510_15660 [Ktedonobacterales bacterium]